jgi:uncharacterized membrane protein
VAVITGVVALEFLLGWALDQDDPTWLPAMATGLIMAVLSIIRLWRSELHSVSRQSNQGNGLQFSIRGLMLLTLLVAVFIAMGKHMRQVGVDGPT